MVVIKGGSHGSISDEETWAREIAFFARALANEARSNEKQNPAGLLPSGMIVRTESVQAFSIPIVSPKM